MLACMVIVWLFVLSLHVRGAAPESSRILLYGIGIACAATGWLYFGRHTVISIGEGHLTIPSWFGSVRIPVALIQSARVVRLGFGALLEVRLHEVPEALRPHLNTFEKRRYLAMLTRLKHRMPEEPSLLISVAEPECDDATLLSLLSAATPSSR